MTDSATIEEEILVCDNCGDEEENLDYSSYYEASICNFCADDLFTCHWCHEESHNDSAIYLGSSSERICEGCYSNAGFYCEGCNEIFHVDDSRSTDWALWCVECYQDQGQHELVRSYHDNDPITPVGVGEYYVGLEFETYGDVEEMEQHNTGNYWYCEDGSLDSDGFEIVTQPGTLEAWRRGRIFNWDSMGDMSFLQPRNGCGLHIHVSREAFQSASHLWKFVTFHKTNPGFLQAFAGRRSTSYSDWDIRELDSKTLQVVKGQRAGVRYSPLNFLPRETIELRYFYPNPDRDSIMGKIALVFAMVEYTRNIATKKVMNGGLKWDEFLAWCEEHGYHEVVDRARINSVRENGEAYQADMENMGWWQTWRRNIADRKAGEYETLRRLSQVREATRSQRESRDLFEFTFYWSNETREGLYGGQFPVFSERLALTSRAGEQRQDHHRTAIRFVRVGTQERFPWVYYMAATPVVDVLGFDPMIEAPCCESCAVTWMYQHRDDALRGVTR